ncbi:MAG: VOC family protein [Myxococcaceae bacterium]
MATKPVPEGLHTLTPQLTVDGAAAAIEWFKKAFGAEERSRAPDPSGKKVWHSELRIGDSALFVNDAFPDMGGTAHPTDLWIYTGDADAVFKRAVDAGAKVLMPMQDMFWGDRTGTIMDKWGNKWTIGKRVKDMSPDEMKKAGEAFVASMPKK